jgi:hypothetical protein
MTPENAGMFVWVGLKLMTIVGLGIYCVFAFVLVRQEQLMSKVLEAQSEKILSVLSWLHLGASIIVLAFAFLIL